MDEVTVPTVRGIKGALANYGLGAVGGLVYTISSQLLGSGLIGGVVSAALAGSVIKGPAGDIIAVVAGFEAARGFQGINQAAEALPQLDIM
jgi:hypothetical protein